MSTAGRMPWGFASSRTSRSHHLRESAFSPPDPSPAREQRGQRLRSLGRPGVRRVALERGDRRGGKPDVLLKDGDTRGGIRFGGESGLEGRSSTASADRKARDDLGSKSANVRILMTKEFDVAIETRVRGSNARLRRGLVSGASHRDGFEKRQHFLKIAPSGRMRERDQERGSR